MSTGLILLQTEVSYGASGLRQIVQRLSLRNQVAISSLVREIDDHQKTALHNRLISVLRFKTQDPLVVVLSKIEETLADLKGATCRLLCFDEVVELKPGTPIPHPDLTMDPVTLHCAAEVYGDYVHPVLGQTLQDLAKSQYNKTNKVQFEFFSRGDLLMGDK